MNRRAVTFVALICMVAFGQPTDPGFEGFSADLEDATAPATSEVAASHNPYDGVLVSDQPTTVNLLDLQGRVVQGLGLVDLAVATYNQARLLLNPQRFEPRPSIDLEIQYDDIAPVRRPTFETTSWHLANTAFRGQTPAWSAYWRGPTTHHS